MKILVSDFDGTFFDKNYLENINRINKFVDEGNMFIIATGRNINNLKMDISDYNIKYSYLICSDGASIYDNKNNNIFNCEIDRELINPICDLLDSDPNIDLTFIENDNIVSGTHANKIAGKFIDKEKCKDLVETLKQKFPLVSCYLSKFHINIRNKKVSKYEGIRFLILNCNLNSNNIYTIGDDINDIEMCKEFNSFSFYHADAEIKNISKTLVNSFSEVIDILEKC